MKSGLDNVEKNISLYYNKKNIGNPTILPDIHQFNLNNYKEDIMASKLSKYISYLKLKNLALIKLDIEGHEARAIEGGIDLIIKYHVPFIFMEWTPSLVRLKGTDPKIFLEIFDNNGYKISIKDFLSKEYCSVDQLLNKNQINIYIIYIGFIE